jgi:hypothetical protein
MLLANRGDMSQMPPHEPCPESVALPLVRTTRRERAPKTLRGHARPAMIDRSAASDLTAGCAVAVFRIIDVPMGS